MKSTHKGWRAGFLTLAADRFKPEDSNRKVLGRDKPNPVELGLPLEGFTQTQVFVIEHPSNFGADLVLVLKIRAAGEPPTPTPLRTPRAPWGARGARAAQ